VRQFLDGLSGNRERTSFQLTIHPEADLHLPGLDPIPMPGDLMSLRRSVAAAYAARFGPRLSISANLDRRAPLVVYVTGDVRSPGAYPWTEGLTPLVAIARAGGFTESSDISAVTLLEQTGEGAKVTTLDFSALLRRQGVSLGAELEAEDVIVVPHTPAFR
jgi:protein involved in polysaccharide export with SLBB domain